MLNLDINLFYKINSLAGQEKFWDKIGILGAKYSVLIFALVLLVYLFKNRHAFWVLALTALVSRGILTEAIRFFYKRPRPFLALENVKQLVEKNGQEASFPSGHAAFLFAVAFGAYLFNRKIGGILILAAAVFSLARVFVGIHYPLDIAGGAVVAAISALITYNFFKNRNEHESDRPVS